MLYGSRNSQHGHWILVPSAQPHFGFLLEIKFLRKILHMYTPFSHSPHYVSLLTKQHKRGFLIHLTASTSYTEKQNLEHFLLDL